MEYLTDEDIIEIHAQVVSMSGGSMGIRDRGAIASSAAQPMATFGGQELYVAIEEKAAALTYSLITNHAFVDGNKRIGHAAAATFLRLNGFQIVAPVAEQEAIVLSVASGSISREDLTCWIRQHLQAISVTP